MHGTAPNSLFKINFFALRQSTTGDNYVLMIRDDHSGYGWIYPIPNSMADQGAHALLYRCFAFRAPLSSMSDLPTHFNNKRLAIIAQRLRSKHHITAPYCSWSSGAVERFGKDMLRLCRAVISEHQLLYRSWPDIVPLIQSALKNAPSPQRANLSPIQCFTELPATPPISTFLRSHIETPLSLTEAQCERSLQIKNLQKLAPKIHLMVNQTPQHNRQLAHDAQTRDCLPNVIEGDYVLVAMDDFF